MAEEMKFEDKLKRIDEIVNILDSGEENIENMLKLYEEGMGLASESRKFLDAAEQKIIDISKKYEIEADIS